MQDFNNAVFFALVSNILTTFRATVLAFCFAETFTAAEALNLNNAWHTKNNTPTEICFEQLK